MPAYKGPKIGRRLLASIDDDIRALELRREGLTYAEISSRLGRSGNWSQGAVRRALAMSVSETADEVREVEIQRIESYVKYAMRILHSKYYVVNQGKVILDPDTGRPLLDPMPGLYALDRLIKLSEAMREFRGLNAPKRSEHAVITVDAIQAEILRVRAQLSAVSPEAAQVIQGTALPPGTADDGSTTGGEGRPPSSGAGGEPPASPTVVS